MASSSAVCSAPSLLAALVETLRLAAALIFSLIVIGYSVVLYKNFTEVPRLHSEWLRKVICLRCSTVYAPAP